MKPIFTGVATAVITPFTEGGTLDLARFDGQIRRQLDAGIDGLVVCGTTGECPTIGFEERCLLIEKAVKLGRGNIPVIAGSGSNDTEKALELGRSAEMLGADAHLVVTPYYNKTSQEGLVRHFFYLADRLKKPIIVYNIPSRTGVAIKPETYARLAEHPNITGVKEADYTEFPQKKSVCPDEFHFWSGNDDMTLPMMSLGGMGVISVVSNLCPEVMVEITNAAMTGNFVKAASIQKKYTKLMSAMFVDVNPIPVKTAMKILGFDCGKLRLPLCEMSTEAENQLMQEMKKVNLL